VWWKLIPDCVSATDAPEAPFGVSAKSASPRVRSALGPALATATSAAPTSAVATTAFIVLGGFLWFSCCLSLRLLCVVFAPLPWRFTNEEENKTHAIIQHRMLEPGFF